MPSARSYEIYDVFTDRRLAGNPLGVVHDCEGLDTAAMQAIAREFNLSETIFVLPAENNGHRARIRIFTPDYEMPFAGHPTVGGAIAIAARDGITDGILVLEENIGPVRCAVTTLNDHVFAEFDLPKLPQRQETDLTKELVAAALGIGPHEVGFEDHVVSVWNAGVPYVCVPLADLGVAGRVSFNNDLWMQIAPEKSVSAVASAYVYTRDTVQHDSAFHARMFVPGAPSYEDPATGSAAAAFSGTIVHFDQPVDGSTTLWIEQGVEMGRSSRIRLELEMASARLARARIGGHAVKIMEGNLFT